MAERDDVDKELAQLRRNGKTPRVIYLGSALFFELESEQNTQYAADVVGEGGKAGIHSTEELKEYDGVRVELLENEARDYLRIDV
jgi:hypothetical protein